jgi:nucleotide-binding universal stress UspA family protein
VLLGVLIECPIFLWIYFDNYAEIEVARTKIFLLFVFVELIIAMSFRSLRYSIFEAPPHKWLLLAMAWELGLLGVLIQFPSVRETFGISMPTWSDLTLALALSALVVCAIEVTKAFLRATTGRTPLAVPSVASFATPASVSSRFTGANTMLKILIPVAGSPNCQFAVKHVVKQFMNNTAMEVHLLNVQPPFNRDIASFVSSKNRQDYHRDQAEKALHPIRQTLDNFGIPYSVHIEVGEKARCIADTARRLRCDQIVMGTARKNSLTRLVENSVTNKVLELTPVPVEVIPGDAVSKYERYGIPAALAALLALLLAAVAE